jgi:hypothetical protein
MKVRPRVSLRPWLGQSQRHDWLPEVRGGNLVEKTEKNAIDIQPTTDILTE